jgi:hypothetical protein
MHHTLARRLAGALVVLSLGGPARAQVDEERAKAYFAEAQLLCERDGGRLWGVSLCGPMVFADPVTGTIATSQPAPDAPRPRILGFANAAIAWGDVRWSTFVWPMIPADDAHARGRLMMHELFHRVQPQLGLLVPDGRNDHLDTLEGRYWMRLEWRALARALGATGDDRRAAVRDALAFRAARRTRFAEAAENERPLETNEGLAQYTGTVTAATSAAEATADAIAQLARAENEPTFVRTFAYPSGAAYGILLDGWTPGWPRRISEADDLGDLVATATGIAAEPDASAAAVRYGGSELKAAEEQRDAEHRARVADLRRRFVEGPVLVVPRGRNASFVSTGMTPIPDAGTVYPGYRVAGEWGSLQADLVLVSTDGATLAVPAPANPEGPNLAGEGWAVTLNPGWIVRPGPRAGDFVVERRER